MSAGSLLVMIRVSSPLFLRFLVLAISLSCDSVGLYAAQRDSNASAVEERKFSLQTPFVLDLVKIPAGRFLMGDLVGTGQADEQPLREVDVEDFWMMRTEVTLGMFKTFASETGYATANHCWVFKNGWVKKNGLSWRQPGFSQDDSHPVTCISWFDARAFIVWLNEQTGLQFRLPTEAEWEYAARAGSNTIYYTGNDPSALCNHANAADINALQDYPSFSVNDCDDGFVRTSPVASFMQNPWGLFDIYGNVWEWVEDCWSTSYADAPTDGSAAIAGDCDRRGFRGGGYGDIPHFARSTLRNRGHAEQRKDDVGFRLVATTIHSSTP